MAVKVYKVTYRQTATADILDVYRWVYEISLDPMTAERFTARLVAACERIGNALISPTEWSGWNVSAVTASTPTRAAKLVGIAQPPAWPLLARRPPGPGACIRAIRGAVRCCSATASPR